MERNHRAVPWYEDALDIECPRFGSDAGNKIQCPTIGVWTSWYVRENGKVGDVTVIYCLLKYLCHSFPLATSFD
jgi:hypothetical protein